MIFGRFGTIIQNVIMGRYGTTGTDFRNVGVTESGFLKVYVVNGSGGGGSLEFSDGDSVDVPDVTTVIVHDGDLTDNGGGSVTLRTAGDVSSTGALSSLPAASKDGILYFPTNGNAIYRDNGSTQKAFYPNFQVSYPSAASFSWVNQGSATANNTAGPLFFSSPAESGDNIKLLVTNTPTAPYTAIMGFRPTNPGVNYTTVGMALRESSSGKLVTFNFSYGNGFSISSSKWNSVSSWSGAYFDMPIHTGGYIWYKIYDNNTARYYYYSIDGQNFLQLYSVSRTDFITPDQIGFFVNVNNASWPSGIEIFHWSLA